MIFLISVTEIGSTPAKGSSNKINFGFAANARAISTRRRSPPERDCPRLSRIWPILNSSINSSALSLRCSAVRSLRISNTAIRFSYTVKRRKIEASCGK